MLCKARRGFDLIEMDVFGMNEWRLDEYIPVTLPLGCIFVFNLASLNTVILSLDYARHTILLI